MIYEKYKGEFENNPSTIGDSGVPLAPIVFFVYNRLEHTRRTVESLKRNHLACKSDLYIFSDGAKDSSAVANVRAVRDYLRTIDGFRSVSISERECNYGLANSVIDGVSRVCERYGRVVVVEDDLLSAPDFLTFVNRALVRYDNEKQVFSVTGFNFPVLSPPDYPYDAFFTLRCSSWGWGTWNDRWQRADWNISDFGEFSHDPQRQRQFNRGGHDLTRMLKFQMAGKINSWAIRWAYAHFKNRAVALYPVQSKILNIGLDGSGVHCRVSRLRQHALTATEAEDYRFPDSVEETEIFTNQIRDLHRVSLARRLAPEWLKSVGIWLLSRKMISAVRLSASRGVGI